MQNIMPWLILVLLLTVMVGGIWLTYWAAERLIFSKRTWKNALGNVLFVVGLLVTLAPVVALALFNPKL